MRRLAVEGSVILAVLLLTVGVRAQGSSSQSGTGSSTTVHVKKTTRRKAKRRVIAMETAPAASPAVTANASATAAQQRATDQQILQQQQARSDKAAQVNDQIVRTAQKQADQRANETRIQDAPGPAQTGVVPAAGPPVAPVNTSAPNAPRIVEPPTSPPSVPPSQLPATPQSAPPQS